MLHLAMLEVEIIWRGWELWAISNPKSTMFRLKYIPSILGETWIPICFNKCHVRYRVWQQALKNGHSYFSSLKTIHNGLELLLWSLLPWSLNFECADREHHHHGRTVYWNDYCLDIVEQCTIEGHSVKSRFYNPNSTSVWWYNIPLCENFEVDCTVSFLPNGGIIPDYSIEASHILSLEIVPTTTAPIAPPQPPPPVRKPTAEFHDPAILSVYPNTKHR